MGEGLWRLEHGERANARSCGVIPADFVDGYTISVMEELDCDLSEFSPIALSGVGEPAAEIVVSLSTAADRTAREYAERTGATFLAWPIAEVMGEIFNKLGWMSAVLRAVAVLVVLAIGSWSFVLAEAVVASG